MGSPCSSSPCSSSPCSGKHDRALKPAARLKSCALVAPKHRGLDRVLPVAAPHDTTFANVADDDACNINIVADMFVYDDNVDANPDDNDDDIFRMIEDIISSDSSSDRSAVQPVVSRYPVVNVVPHNPSKPKKKRVRKRKAHVKRSEAKSRVANKRKRVNGRFVKNAVRVDDRSWVSIDW